MFSRNQNSETPATRLPVHVPASEPAWKRKRATSPARQAYYTPNPAKKVTSSIEFDTTPARAGGERRGFETSKKLFENVGQRDWRSNDIARQQEEAKKRDMEVLLNRFKHVSKTEEQEERERSRSPPKHRRSPSPQRRSPSPQRPARSPIKSSPGIKKYSPKKSSRSSLDPSPDNKHYPGVNSLKKIKVSPPRDGQLYPNLNDIHDDRTETATTSESSASEAPSLGVSIRLTASGNK